MKMLLDGRQEMYSEAEEDWKNENVLRRDSCK